MVAVRTGFQQLFLGRWVRHSRSELEKRKRRKEGVKAEEVAEVGKKERDKGKLRGLGEHDALPSIKYISNLS